MTTPIVYNRALYQFVKGETICWSEIYSMGREEPGIIPSEPGPVLPYFSEDSRLRRAVEIQLGKVERRLAELTDKIVGEQEEERREILERDREIVAGTFNGFIDVGTPATIQEYGQRLKQGIEEMAGEEYQRRIFDSEIVSVELGEGIVYAGLVRVAKGLTQFLQEGKYVQDVMGDIVGIYDSLSN